MSTATVRDVLGLLSPGERRRGGLVLATMVVMAFIETLSVASVIPFLAVLGNPALVRTNEHLAWLMAVGGFDSADDFLFALGVAGFLVVVGASLFRAFAQYIMFRFVNMRRHTIGARLLQAYLRQPYEFFLRRNPAELSKLVLSEVDQLIQNVYRPGMQMLAYGMAALVLAGFLVVLDPLLAGIVAGGLALTYGAVYLAVRSVLGRIGRERVAANQERFVSVSEVLGGIKAVKLMGSEQVYLERFSRPSLAFARYQSIAETLSTVPKFIVEAVGLGGILLLALTLMSTRGDLGSVLPVLGLYAFASYRLLPAAQNVFAGFARLRFGVSTVADLSREVRHVAGTCTELVRTVSPFRLSKGVRLEDVAYNYPGGGRAVVHGLTLEIPARASVAFVGSTGAGKTTVVDLIVGLIKPTAGRILVDDRDLHHEELRSWQASIGYVPQDVYLADTSIAENIAFGVPSKDIDQRAVIRAAKAARIHDFIVSELKQGYETTVGDRGVRLSGGQRQRIGIARALYHNPDILVLDEATSALDSVTEQAIMSVLADLRSKKTLILIAHRLTTVQQCDRIFLLDNGRLISQGTYDELMESSTQFRQLAGS